MVEEKAAAGRRALSVVVEVGDVGIGIFKKPMSALVTRQCYNMLKFGVA